MVEKLIRGSEVIGALESISLINEPFFKLNFYRDLLLNNIYVRVGKFGWEKSELVCSIFRMFVKNWYHFLKGL